MQKCTTLAKTMLLRLALVACCGMSCVAHNCLFNGDLLGQKNCLISSNGFVKACLDQDICIYDKSSIATWCSQEIHSLHPLSFLFGTRSVFNESDSISSGVYAIIKNTQELTVLNAQGDCIWSCDVDSSCPIVSALDTGKCMFRELSGAESVKDNLPVSHGQLRTEAVNCFPGTYFNDGLCYLCGLGLYSTSYNSTTCTSCPQGTYNSQSGATACTPCSAGSASTQTGAMSSLTCTACPAGSSSSSGAATCSPCASGQYSSLPDSLCANCAVGHYAKYPGSTTCLECPAGSFQMFSGSSSCGLCPAGFYSGTGQHQCTPCGNGAFAPISNSTTCQTCPLGYSSVSTSASTSCNYCSPGQTSTTPVSSTCANCGAGTFSSNFASSVCTNCAAGYYQPYVEQSSCYTCSGGSFSSTGQAQCTLCPAGTYADILAATSQSNCTTCSLGHYCPAGSTAPLVCGAGTFSDHTGSTSCTLCAGGTYSGAIDAFNSSTCVKCTAGHYCPAGSAQPLPCATGSYAGANYTTCTLCPGGTFSDVALATNSSVCQVCVAGAFCPAGSSSELQCVAGRYSYAKSSECSLCARGKFSSTVMATSVDTCRLCPYHSTTPILGAPSSAYCFNPTPNFLSALITLILTAFIANEYLFRGRFHRVAFLRRQRVVQMCVTKCRELFVVLERMELDVNSQEGKQEQPPTSYFTIFAFLFLSSLLLIGGAIVYYFVSMNYVFFSAMILWRGLYIKVPFMKTIHHVIAELTNLLQIPNFIFWVFYPFTYVLEAIGKINLNLGAVQVSCAGSQAPLELLLNCLIIGLVVIIIESEFLLFWVTTFKNINFKFLTIGLQGQFTGYNWSISKRCKLVLYGFAMTAMTALNPMRMLLQYLMGFVTTTQFSEYNARHRSTPACDQVSGLLGLDTAYAVVTTMIAYLMLPAIVYTLARLLVPGKGHAFARGSNDIYVLQDPASGTLTMCYTYGKKLAAWVSVDLYWAKLADLWLSFLCRSMPFTSTTTNTNTTADSSAKSSNTDASINDAPVTKSVTTQVVSGAPVLLAMSSERTAEENSKWRRYNQSRLPAYIQLSHSVYAELHPIWSAMHASMNPRLHQSTQAGGNAILWVLCYTGAAHAFSVTGRHCWTIIFLKYMTFFLCSMGIWSRTSIATYGVDRTVADMTEEDLENNDEAKTCQEHYASALTGLIAPRAILYQLIPQLSILSVYSIGMAGIPLCYYSAKADEQMYPWIVWNCYKVARDRELLLNKKVMEFAVKHDRKHDEEAVQDWVIALQGFNVLITESRLIKFVLNASHFGLAVAILYTSTKNLAIVLISSIILFVPQALAASVLFIVFLGKQLGIKDQDLASVGLLIRSSQALDSDEGADVEHPQAADEEAPDSSIAGAAPPTEAVDCVSVAPMPLQATSEIELVMPKLPKPPTVSDSAAEASQVDDRNHEHGKIASIPVPAPAYSIQRGPSLMRMLSRRAGPSSPSHSSGNEPSGLSVHSHRPALLPTLSRQFSGADDDDTQTSANKPPGEMTLAELKRAIHMAGISHETLGFATKIEFIELLENYRAEQN